MGELLLELNERSEIVYKLCFYVPHSHLDSVKLAAFNAGAGAIGCYDQCCWQVQGVGQFRPKSGSNPALGRIGQLEQVDEWRVEMICEEGSIHNVVSAMKSAHPYEEVAYDVVKIEDI